MDGGAVTRPYGRFFPGLFLLFLFALTACAPRIELPGPAVLTPHMTDTHAVMADGARLPLHVWGPEADPRAVIVALHGFNDYGAFFAPSAPFFTESGFRIYAYDQRGFGSAPNNGLWPGTQAFIDDLKAVAALVRDRYPDKPLYVLGESMGGAIVMLSMTKEPRPAVDGVILSAPAVWARSTMPLYQRAALWVAAHTVPWMTVSGRGLNIIPSDNEPMLIALGKDPLVIKDTRVDTVYGLTNLMDEALLASPRFGGPSLVLYGLNDEIIPREPTARMMSAMAGRPDDKPLIALYPKGYHMLTRDLDAETVRRDIAAWIASPKSPLPSEGGMSPAQAAQRLSKPH
ncbi:MAG: lysophospholipase [Rhodospirillales bacterium]|nr:lysophospholipase [Rhodospirillales bacterium]